MTQIIEANISHEKIVLILLDQFRTACAHIINPDDLDFKSRTAKENGSLLFRNAVKDKSSIIFLAQVKGVYIGLVTVYLIPQIRCGSYVAEIEEIYVKKDFQGTKLASDLMRSAIEWASEHKARAIRLETALPLKRAHGFYKKNGFSYYADAYHLAL